MKKVKKLIVALVIVLAFAVMSVSASAANHTTTDQGAGSGYTWNSYLTSTDTSVTASITVRANDSGPVPTNLSARTYGSARTQNGSYLSLDSTATNSGQKTVTAARSNSTTAADPIEFVTCTFYAQGIQAGNTASYYN